MLAPHPLEIPLSPGAGPVELVAQGVLLVVVLVVVFGRIERGGGNDLSRDGPIERSGLRKRRFGCKRRSLLLLGVVEDGGPILAAVVRELSVGLSRVDVAPEDVQQRLIRDLGRVIGDLDRLRMSRRAGGHLFVGGMGFGAAGVP